MERSDQDQRRQSDTLSRTSPDAIPPTQTDAETRLDAESARRDAAYRRNEIATDYDEVYERRGSFGRAALYVLFAVLVLGAIWVGASSLWGPGTPDLSNGQVAPAVNGGITPNDTPPAVGAAPAPDLAPTPGPTPTPTPTPTPAPATPPAQ